MSSDTICKKLYTIKYCFHYNKKYVTKIFMEWGKWYGVPSVMYMCVSNSGIEFLGLSGKLLKIRSKHINFVKSHDQTSFVFSETKRYISVKTVVW